MVSSVPLPPSGPGKALGSAGTAEMVRPRAEPSRLFQRLALARREGRDVGEALTFASPTALVITAPPYEWPTRMTGPLICFRTLLGAWGMWIASGAVKLNL